MKNGAPSFLFARLAKAIKRRVFAPHVKTTPVADLCRMGSRYGGWVFVDRPEVVNSTIVSCGLGEDACFDVEFAAKYASKVVIVDPTPRAVEHYDKLVARVGSAAAGTYADSGSQPIDAYEMSAISLGQLVLVPEALADHVGVIRFFAPPDSKHVSHSIVNFQNGYSEQTTSIQVPCIDVATLRLKLRGVTPPLVKMDIEGAEILVIPEFISEGWLPIQLLVEYDELNFPSRRGRRNFDQVDTLLRASGYAAVYWDGRSCVTYLLRDYL